MAAAGNETPARRVLMAAMAMAVLVSGSMLVAGSVAATDEPVSITRVFQLRHAKVSEVLTAIQPLLSDSGSFSVKMSSARITVQDRPEVVARIAALLQELDRPPTEFRIRVELLEAGIGDGQTGDLFVDPRVRTMFQYDTYRRIGVTVLVGELGSAVVADLGGGYQISFTARSVTVATGKTSGSRQSARTTPSPWSMPATAGDGSSPSRTKATQLSPRIQLHRLTLVRTEVDENGLERQVQVLRSNVLLATGQQVVVGAGSSEKSAKALILIVRTEPAGVR